MRSQSIQPTQQLCIAEYIGGSEANWIERMKAKLNEGALRDATIINVTGLPE